MGKLTLLVCPHDTAKDPEKWYLFAQYLSLALHQEIHFDLHLDFQSFHQNLEKAHIVYANPKDNLRLIKNLGFLPLVRPDGLYDEAVFIAHDRLHNPTLESLDGEKIATVPHTTPADIGISILKRHAVQPSEWVERASWLGVINSVRKGQVPFGLVYKDAYDDLSDLSKSLVNAFFLSKERTAFHSISISPQLHDQKDQLLAILLTMATEERGREVLASLQIGKWLALA
jgi:phosphonate transport system substrate-binding protein